MQAGQAVQLAKKATYKPIIVEMMLETWSQRQRWPGWYHDLLWRFWIKNNIAMAITDDSWWSLFLETCEVDTIIDTGTEIHMFSCKYMRSWRSCTKHQGFWLWRWTARWSCRMARRWSNLESPNGTFLTVLSRSVRKIWAKPADLQRLLWTCVRDLPILNSTNTLNTPSR